MSVPLHQHHAAVAAAVAATVSGSVLPGRQLLLAQSQVAPWIDRHEREAGPLPPPLDHGPIELLRRVRTLAQSPLGSAKLVDDAVILLTYGASYLQDDYDETRSASTLKALVTQRECRREQWKTKAEAIQRTWRTQRFHTNRLPVLELKTDEFLHADIQQLMQRKQGMMPHESSVERLTNVPVEVNEAELHDQVVKYAAELQKRVDARKRDAEEIHRRQLREQRAQEEKRKRMIVQKKKRYENACRRWHYFATRLLRTAREDGGGSDRFVTRYTASSYGTQAISEAPRSTAKAVDRSQSMLRVLKNPTQRNVVRRFVGKAVARGISRVLCAYNMIGEDDTGWSFSELVSTKRPHEAEIAASTAIVLRLGLLLCDLHFGIKYTGLYQRFFERVARERGMRVEWFVFNCLKSQFPTRAHQRIVNGFLVAGGPNIGVINDPPHPSTMSESTLHQVEGSNEEHTLPRRSSSNANGATRKNRHFGRWRPRLLGLLCELHARKQTILGGLGLGHTILAEALGGRISMTEWEDGWSLLDPTIFNDESTNPHYLDRRQAQGMQGIRFLHGEYVQSMGRERSGVKHGMKSWKTPGEHSFVACFRDKLTLSMDGSPECGSFVFETLGEFYERDKINRVRVHAAAAGISASQPSRASNVGNIGDEDDEDDEAVFRPITLESTLSMDEKKKRMGITDASMDVARLFFDHFNRQILTPVSPTLASQTNAMAITGVLCSDEVWNVDASIRHLLNLPSIGGIFLNVSASSDGHLMVTSPRAFALLVEHERRAKDQSTKQRPLSLSSSGLFTGRAGSTSRVNGLTLQMLRDQEQGSLILAGSSSSRQFSPRTSIRLPSIRQDISTVPLAADTVMDGADAEGGGRRGLIRRTSKLVSQRHLIDDNVSVLTLSQALSIVTKGDPPAPGFAKPPQKRVFIRLLDEECKLTHALLPLTKSDLRVLWLRLLAAIRIAGVPNEHVAIVSRHAMLLAFIQRKRPTWSFVKDCRRSDVVHRKRLKNIAKYTAYADTVLFDQDFLLSNSANENDMLLKKAQSLGLHVYVAPRDDSPQIAATPPDKLSLKRSSALQRRTISNSSSFGRLSKEINGKTNQGGTEYDVQVVEFMLIQFSGLDGVITSRPSAAVDAQLKVAAKNDAMQNVEQLFRDWQAKDNAKAPSPKRLSNPHPQIEDPIEDQDDPEDYVGAECNYDSDDSIPETEMAVEMARQWGEHSRVGPNAATSSFFAGGGATTPSMAQLAVTPFVSLRPLQQKTADEIFGAGALLRRQSSIRNPTPPPSLTGEGRSRLSSIGSFRAALKRTDTMSQPQQFSLSTADKAGADLNDLGSQVRSAESTVRQVPKRPLRPMSTRKILFTPR